MLTQRDQRGRVMAVTTYDGAATPSPWRGANSTQTGASSVGYADAAVTTKDQDSKQRRTTTDALGRLVQVDEDPTGTIITTTYTYNALDQLIGVNQNGLGRTFQYDTLGRLTSSTNPETGTVTYNAYDANGNLLSITNAAGTVTCYGAWSGATCNSTNAYDALNRVLQKSYSDGTPSVSYTYDTVQIGRLSSISAAGVSTTAYTAYDNFGRVTGSKQTTAGRRSRIHLRTSTTPRMS